MRRMIAAATIAVSATLAAGCASQDPASGASHDPASGGGSPGPALSSAYMPQACTENGPVVFVVSGRQNSPAPVLTGAMQSAAATAVREGSAIGLVGLDGRPRLIVAGTFRDPGANLVALQAAQQTFLNSLTSAVEHTRAEFPGADVLDALNVAGHAIRAACPHGGTIYLEDSGLQVGGQVNFRQPGLLSAAPADVVSFLARQHDLPYLTGTTVILAGLGDTALPQAPLSISQQANVTAIWTAIAKAGGAASVRVDPAPLTGPAPGHVPPVLLVTVPAARAWTPSDPSYVFPDSGPVGFQPNTAVFRDPAAARAALQRLAGYLAADPSARIELTGTTARWGTFAWDLTLSKQRAETVKAALVQLGASSGQIKTQGLGWRFPGYANDQGPDGSLLPGPAEQNRSVIVTQI